MPPPGDSNINSNDKPGGSIHPNRAQEEQEQEHSYLEINVCDVAPREQTKLIGPHCRIQTLNIVRLTESVHFVSRKISARHDGNVNLSIVQDMEIQTEGGALALQWSPILQWSITSAVKKILMVIDYYRNIMKQGRKDTMSTKKKEREKIPNNILIRSNDTSLKVTAVLGGSSLCNVFTKDLSVKVYQELNDTWDKPKPNVVCDVGDASLYLNDHDNEIAKLSSFRFSDTMRRASADEIAKYCGKKKKKKGNTDIFDEVVTGSCGTPLVERFELSFGDFTRVDMPPTLHLGKVIEDITLAE